MNNNIKQKHLDDRSGTGEERSLRILIADDDEQVRDILKLSLQFLNHRVIGTASNGKECTRLVDQVRPDLVILDLHMPVMDGVEAAAEIRQRTAVPIILSTGIADEMTAGHLRGVDIAGVLAKPFGPTQLKAAINAAMQHQSQFKPALAHCG